MSVDVGDVYGIYKVIQKTEDRAPDGHRYYVVRCIECNRQFRMIAGTFSRKRKIVTKCQHGRANSYRIRNKRLRKTFVGMYDRCYNRDNKDYRWYGSKGVYICDEWLNDPKRFEEWSKSNGYANKLTIDRIDDNGPYAPWNCRWITRKQNSKYKSTTRELCVDNESHTGRDWANILDVGTNRINRYVRTHGKAFTERFIRDTKDGFYVAIPRND